LRRTEALRQGRARHGGAIGPFGQAVLVADHRPGAGTAIAAIAGVGIKALRDEFAKGDEPGFAGDSGERRVARGRFRSGKAGRKRGEAGLDRGTPAGILSQAVPHEVIGAEFERARIGVARDDAVDDRGEQLAELGCRHSFLTASVPNGSPPAA
jgi:hypothetical protein